MLLNEAIQRKEFKEYLLQFGNYRSFIVTANSKEQARSRFEKASLLQRKGFELKEMTGIKEISPEGEAR